MLTDQQPLPHLAKEIHRCNDEFGVIRVLDDGNYRFLAFGDGGEQSCVDWSHPELLVHDYTKTMLMALCFMPHATHATVIGVGAGSLITALHYVNHSLIISAVELRDVVVDVAMEWFDFKPSTNVTLNIADASAYLCGSPRHTDLLFIDIYNDEGIDEGVSDYEFIADCYETLNLEGVLVMNLWHESTGLHRRVLKHIKRYFLSNVFIQTLSDGNIVVFAKKSKTQMVLGHEQQLMGKVEEVTGIKSAVFLRDLQPYR